MSNGRFPIKRATTSLSVAGLLFFCNTTYASAHFLPRPKHLDLSQKIRYFERNIDHDRSAIIFLKSHKKLYKKNAYKKLLRWHKNALAWQTQLLYRYSQKWYNSFTPAQAIAVVFGQYSTQAYRVAYCETGGTFSLYAQNGQYLGLFQMGDHERATYATIGYSTAYQQSRAAYNYFTASGRNWSPWSCKPW